MVNDRALFVAASLSAAWLLAWFLWLRGKLPWGSKRQLLVTGAVQLIAFVSVGFVFGELGVLLVGLVATQVIVALIRMRSRLGGRR